jgi:selenide,water dikinase
VLRALPVLPDPNVLVGLESPDDAAVVRLSNDLAIVFTNDFFTPIVDDPRTFGRIAAANALSDVYAMGAKPLVALNIAAFPSKTLPLSVLGEILTGGAEMAHEAGIQITGGHTVDDPEPKYGLAVVGTVHPDRIWRKGGAQAGDAIVLTKALGTGVLSTALKRDRLTESTDAAQAMIASMTTLNARAVAVAQELAVSVHAATDVTGYGLTGHLHEMLRSSPATRAVLRASALPLLPEAALLAREGFIAGGTRANREHLGGAFRVDHGVPDEIAFLACDAQTSGGLLMAVPMSQADAFVAELRARAGLAHATIVGSIEASESASIDLVG